MQALILAAGISRRLRPLCSGKPKPMYRIMGKPILHYNLSALREAGITDTVIVKGYLGEQIKSYFGEGRDYGLRISYTQQDNSLGMGDALRAASSFLEEHFILINGSDVIEPEAVKLVIQEFRKGSAEIVLCSRTVANPEKFGILGFDEHMKVKRIVEKPSRGKEPSQYAVVSPYLISRSLVKEVEALPASDTQFEDAIQRFMDNGKEVRAAIYSGSFSTVKYPWDILEVSRDLMTKHVHKPVILSSKVSERSEIEGPVMIEADARVVAGAKIVGPCYIGKGAFLGHNALLRDYASVDSGSIVGYSTEVKNSVVGMNCLFHSNYVGDSVIEDGCILGAGAVTANLRFDWRTIGVKVEERRMDSGLVKLGTMMGDRCNVGVNASIMPGVRLGPDSIVGPGVVLYRDLPSNSSIFVNAEKSYTISFTKPGKKESRREEKPS